MNFKSLAGVALALMFLAGCGASPTEPSSPKQPRQARLQERPPVGGANPMGQNPRAAAEGARLLAGVRQMFAQAKGFDATVRSYTEGHYKSGQKVSELRKSTTSARLIWMKPQKLRAEVITSTNSLLEGAAMVTTDGRNITARAKGLLGLIPFKLTASDVKMSTNRNHSFTENNPNSHVVRFTGQTAVWTLVGEATIEGVPCKLVAVDNVKRLDREVTREILAIDPTMFGLRQVTMYTGDTKVVQHTFTKFKWNPAVSSKTFSI